MGISVKINCDYCGTDIYRTECRLNSSKNYCSLVCLSLSKRKRINVSCNSCGKAMEIIKSRYDACRGKKFYCSVECRGKNVNVDLVLEMMMLGFSITRISKIFNVRRATIYNKLSKHNHEKKEKKRKAYHIPNPVCNDTQKIDEKNIFGKFLLKPEWRLPQAFTPEENNFNKWEYFELVGISPKFVTMHNINLARITYTTTRNGKEVEESSVEVCTGDSLKECKSLEDSWEGVNHRISKLCKNDFTIIGVEVIKKIGETSLYSNMSKN